MADAPTNAPKVLIEFTPDELSWLADRLHEEWQRGVTAGALVSKGDKETLVADHKKRTIELLNRLTDKAHDQGFGNL